MRTRQYGVQSGFALLIFVVVLMGIGGIALVNFSQSALEQVEKKKFLHNQRVLKEAKQALLQFAFNLPVNSGIGPGRLPCADTDNDGKSNSCFSVGRLPWDEDDLNLYDIRDADGQRLWYAVSSNFRTANGGIPVNSDSSGRIAIRDQSGQIIYNGNAGVLTKYGVAAVVIAPGSITSRNGVAQDRSIANVNVASSYLDQVVGIEDNATLGQNTNDGFILGPVNGDTTNAVNDQIIIITAAEVIEMAEKATLQAYRNAINDYQQKIWGTTTANYRYPWLDSYGSVDGLATFNADITPSLSDPVIGRVPSIFGAYFNGASSGLGSIESRLELDFSYDGASWNETTVIADVNFDGSGDLITNINSSPPLQTFYFWDGHADPAKEDPYSPHDGVWELCTGTAGTGEDKCNRKTDGTFKTPADANPAVSDVWLEVKIITMQFNPTAGLITFLNADLIGLSTTTPYEAPTGTKHAKVAADYNNGSGYLAITNDIDDNFKAGYLDRGDGPAFGVDPTDRIRVGIRYYPELPAWALGDSWHDEMMLAYSAAMQPDGFGICTPPVFPVSVDADYCLSLLNSGGVINNKSAMLVISGSSPGFSDVGAPNFYADDLEDVFEGENSTDALPYGTDFGVLENNLTFDRRPTNGNDIVLVVQ